MEKYSFLALHTIIPATNYHISTSPNLAVGTNKPLGCSIMHYSRNKRKKKKGKKKEKERKTRKEKNVKNLPYISITGNLFA